MLTRGPVQRFHIVGTVRFGGVSSLGGATMAIFDLPTAQRLFNKEGKLDTIGIASKQNVTPGQLVSEVKPLLPATAQVRTGAQEAKQAAKDTNGFLSFLEYFLLAFGFIALFVGVFVIANTLGITIAQRSRELATLRTLGATRRQVYWSVVLEAFVIGAIASVIGLFLGLALAKLLNTLFVSFGIDLPQVGTVFKTRTIVVALIVGIVVTLIASIRPALRATRVEPIAAVREGAVLPPSRLARFGPYIAIVVIIASVGLMLVGLFVGGLWTKLRLALARRRGPRSLRRRHDARADARPADRARARLAGARWGGAPGRLARGNSIRNPSRTASTASALMIGVTLVTLVSVLAAGIKSTFSDSVNKLFTADYALTSENGFTPTSVASEKALEARPRRPRRERRPRRRGRGLRRPDQITAVEPNVSKVIDLKWKEGSPATPAQLGRSGAFVAKAYAKDHDLTVGSPIDLKTPDGGTMHLTLRGIFDPPKGGSPVRRRHDLDAALRPRVREPAGPVLVRHGERRGHGREHGTPHRRAREVPRREDPDEVAVHQAAGERHLVPAEVCSTCCCRSRS